ncbi:MAG TPA: hypothetical protein VNN19_09895, partial [bacterium]|nr:hypothetical protein [bacterium]
MARRSVGVVALVAVAFAAALWAALARAGGAVEVDAVRIRRGDLEVTLPVSGVVETRSVELAFEIPGRLVEVRV